MSDEETLRCRQPDVDPDWWFKGPETYEASHARRLCLHCPAYWDCADYALTEGIPWGIWGGVDGKQRAKIWRQRGEWPTGFIRSIDAQVGPLLRERREHENFDTKAGAA